MRFLTSRGLDEAEVRAGSIPQRSLDFVGSVVASELPSDGPVFALHIGNFVGVSLAYISEAVRRIHPASVVWSVDPNVAHRGIANPAEQALALLGHFGLTEANVVITGYTLEQNLGDERESDPVASFESQRRPEHVLRNLASRAGVPFGLVFMDGNHYGPYVAREIDQIKPLLAPGALIVIDDVDEWTFPLVTETFKLLAANDTFKELGRDGRLGVLRRSLG